jgi:hypothetical protein
MWADRSRKNCGRFSIPWNAKIYRPQVSPRDRTNGRKETLQSGEAQVVADEHADDFFTKRQACLRELREMNLTR